MKKHGSLKLHLNKKTVQQATSLSASCQTVPFFSCLYRHKNFFDFPRSPLLLGTLRQDEEYFRPTRKKTQA